MWRKYFMSIRDLIINNEKTLLNSFPQYKNIISAFIIKLEKITYDGNIIDFCRRSYDIPAKRDQIAHYHRSGYKSCLDIINENISRLSIRRFTIDDLVLGQSYNSFDICALAMNYNNQIGMYNLPNSKSEYIVKAQINESTINRAPYENAWISKNSIIKYFFQREANLSPDQIHFSHKTNNDIYHDFIKGNYHHIHLFYRNDKVDYYYDGIYCVRDVNISEGYMIIQKIEDFSSIEDDFVKTVLNKVTENSHLRETTINVLYNDENDVIKRQTIRTKKKDFILQNNNNQLLGDFGEQKVLAYEKERLQKIGKPHLADKVKRVSLESDSYGYDILSFEVDQFGRENEINIEVKTTVNNAKTPFYLTRNELNLMLV